MGKYGVSYYYLLAEGKFRGERVFLVMDKNEDLEQWGLAKRYLLRDFSDQGEGLLHKCTLQNIKIKVLSNYCEYRGVHIEMGDIIFGKRNVDPIFE